MDLSLFRSSMRAELIWISLGQLIAAIGSFIGIMWLTRNTSVAAYGEFSLGLTISSAINQILLAPLVNAALRFYSSAKNDDNIASFIGAIRYLFMRRMNYAVLLTAVCCLLLSCYMRIDSIALILTSVVFAAISGINSIIDGIQNAARKRESVACNQVLGTWGRLMCAVGLALLAPQSSAALMLGYIAGSLILLIFQLFCVNKIIGSFWLGSNLPYNAWHDRIVSYTWPFSVWGIFGWLQSASDKWILGLATTTQEVGIYSVLYQIGYYPVALASGVIVQLLTPVLFASAGDNTDKEQLLRVFSANHLVTLSMIVASFIGAALAAKLGDYVFNILVPVEYASSAWLLPGMIISAGLFAAGQCATISLLSANDSKIQLAPKITVALVSILANVLGVSTFGIAGLVYAMMLSSAIYLIWIMFLVSQKRNAIVRISSSAGSPVKSLDGL